MNSCESPFLSLEEQSDFPMTHPPFEHFELPLRLEPKGGESIELKAIDCLPSVSIPSALLSLAEKRVFESGGLGVLVGRGDGEEKAFDFEEAYLLEPGARPQFDREASVLLAREYSAAQSVLSEFCGPIGPEFCPVDELIYFSQFRVVLRLGGGFVGSRVILPRADFALSELGRTFRFPTTPLTKKLFGRESPAESTGSGFLTTDETGRILPLEFGQTGEFPLLGLWLALPTLPESPLAMASIRRRVWGLCTAFLRLSARKLSLHPRGAEFLVFLFANGALRCFKARTGGARLRGICMEFRAPPARPGALSLHFARAKRKVEASTQTEDAADLLSAIRENQRKNEEFYAGALAAMQEQISLLSRTLASMQGSALGGEQSELSRSNGGKAVGNPKVLPAYNHSLSLSASPRDPETPQTRPKRFRADTQKPEVTSRQNVSGNIGEMEFNSVNESKGDIDSMGGVVDKGGKWIKLGKGDIGDTEDIEYSEDKGDIDYKDYSGFKGEGREKSLKVLETVSCRDNPDLSHSGSEIAPLPKADLLSKVQNATREKEYNAGEQVRSIQVPKINTRFRAALQNNSDVSDPDSEPDH